MTRCSSRSNRVAVPALVCAALLCASAGCASVPAGETVSRPSPSAQGEGRAGSETDASAADHPENPAPAPSKTTAPPPDAGTPEGADSADRSPAMPVVAPPPTGTALILGSPTGAPDASDRPREDRPENRAGNGVASAGATAPGPLQPDAQSGAAELQFRLSASPAVLRIGDEVTVEVRASTLARVVDAPLHLAYDTTRLRYVKGEEGNFLNRDGSGTVFLINGRSLPGVVTIGLGRLDRAHGLSGAGTHCRVRFEVIAPGVSRVAVVQAMAWADDGSMLKVGTDAVEVSVPQD